MHSSFSLQLKLTFREEPDEYEYQSEASLLAEYGDEEEDEEEDDDGRHSSVSEDEEPSPAVPAPSGFRDTVPKGTGGNLKCNLNPNLNNSVMLHGHVQ